jgi:hypothetical protein
MVWHAYMENAKLYQLKVVMNTKNVLAMKNAYLVIAFPKLAGMISVVILVISAMKAYASFQEKKYAIKTVTAKPCKDALMVIAQVFVMFMKIVALFPVFVKIKNV